MDGWMVGWLVGRSIEGGRSRALGPDTVVTDTNVVEQQTHPGMEKGSSFLLWEVFNATWIALKCSYAISSF